MISQKIDDGLKAIARVRGVKNAIAGLHELQKELGSVEDGDYILKGMLDLTYNRFINFGVNPTWAEVASSDIGGVTVDFGRPVIEALYDLANTSGLGREGRIERLKAIMQDLNPQAQALVYSIIERDLRCGIAESTINKAFSGLLPTFSVMLAGKYEPRKIKHWPVAVEPKYDGMRVTALVQKGDAKFYTRNGNDVPATAHLAPMVAALAEKLGGDDWAIDGEIIAGVNFNEAISSARSHEPMTAGSFMVFDALPVAEFVSGESVLPYKARRDRLLSAMRLVTTHHGAFPDLKIELAPSYVASSPEEIDQFYERARENKLEGLIVKALDGTWIAKRSPSWMKIKAIESIDLRVTGAFEGTGQFSGSLGGLIVDFNGKRVEVGSGFTHDQRRAFWEEILKDRQREQDATVVLGSLVEMTYQEVTPDGSLRLPIFKRLRTDKYEASF
jgi:DNA ligase 1